MVYDYYGGKKKIPRISDSLMAAVDKGDAARFNEQEVLNPQGWDLMNFIMDARTGLGRFREFTISNYQLMMELIDKCVKMPVEDILMLPDASSSARGPVRRALKPRRRNRSNGLLARFTRTL